MGHGRAAGFAIRGYVLDKERLKNGAFFNKAYYENLLAEIREIRASERKFYQKITDIYATAMDYTRRRRRRRRFSPRCRTNCILPFMAAPPPN